MSIISQFGEIEYLKYLLIRYLNSLKMTMNLANDDISGATLH